jgi:outer membrane biosynthesis protein TonB
MAERSGPSYASSTEDRLPWLEPVEDDAADYVVPRGRLAGGVVIALIAIAVIVGGLFWLRQPRSQASESGEIALIQAPPGNYKTKPADAGGMKVAGQGDTVYQASQGADPNAKIDTSATPEAPVRPPHPTQVASAEPTKAPATTAPTPPAKPAATAPAKPTATAVATPAKPAAKPATKPVQVAAKPTPPKPATTTVALPAAKPAPGVSIQLGAFSSQASADAAWKSLSGRYASLGALSKNIVAVPKGSGTVYRLRASGAGAKDACGKLKAGGASCVVIAN